MRKIFPDHWSFLLGEIALYSFVILLLTGVLPDVLLRPVGEGRHLQRQLRPAQGRGDDAGPTRRR